MNTACTISWPRPGIAKSVSTITVPPISRPRFTPDSVISENDEGRSAWRSRTARGRSPLDRAMRMKSSCSVEIMSERRSWRYTAASATISVMHGRMIDLRLASGSSKNDV